MQEAEEYEAQFDLYVDAVNPNGDGGGNVDFVFDCGPIEEKLRISMPYVNCESLDAGVKQAAFVLVTFGEMLAKKARELSGLNQGGQ